MSDAQPFGWSGPHGWFVANAGGEPNAEQRVSVHESFHHRLDRSTNYGALLLVLGSLTEHGVLDAGVLRPLRDLCRTVHEAAASYLTELVLGSVTTPSDGDRRYRDAMAGVIGDDVSAWVRFHAALALARASLQPDIVTVVRVPGLLVINAATIDSTVRPDDRFRRLRRAPPDLEAAAAEAAHEAGIAEWHPIMTSASLDVRWFAADRRDLWAMFHQHLYGAVSTRLAELGCPTSPVDDNLETSEILLAMGQQHVADLGLVPATRDPSDDRSWAAAVAIDVETPSLAVRRTAVAIDAHGHLDVERLVAGVGEHEHLHVAIRPMDSYLTFDWLGEPPSGRVALRRSLETLSGRVVEHLDVSAFDPGDVLGDIDVRVVATVAESQLTRPELRPWWEFVRRNAYLLSDVPLIGRLRSWIDGGRRRFRYRFLSVTASGAEIAVLVARFEADADQHSHLLVRPVVSNTVGMIRQVLGEIDPTGESTSEDDLLGAGDLGLGFALFHIVGEDSTFGTRVVEHG